MKLITCDCRHRAPTYPSCRGPVHLTDCPAVGTPFFTGEPGPYTEDVVDCVADGSITELPEEVLVVMRARQSHREACQAARASKRRGIAIVFFDAGDPKRLDATFEERVVRLKLLAERELGLRAV